jgi:hypothetical protein
MSAPGQAERTQQAAQELKALTRAAHEAAQDLKAVIKHGHEQVDAYARDQVQAALNNYTAQVEHAVHQFLREAVADINTQMQALYAANRLAVEDWTALYHAFAGTLIAGLAEPTGTVREKREELVALGRRMAAAMARLGIEYEAAPSPQGHEGAHLVMDTRDGVMRLTWSDTPEGRAILDNAAYQVIINPGTDTGGADRP